MNDLPIGTRVMIVRGARFAGSGIPGDEVAGALGTVVYPYDARHNDTLPSGYMRVCLDVPVQYPDDPPGMRSSFYYPTADEVIVLENDETLPALPPAPTPEPEKILIEGTAEELPGILEGLDFYLFALVLDDELEDGMVRVAKVGGTVAVSANEQTAYGLL